MKNFRKPNLTAAAVVRPGIADVVMPENPDDNVLQPATQAICNEHTSPSEEISPEEQSFRAFLQQRLPQRRASASLLKRIQHSIRQIRD